MAHLDDDRCLEVLTEIIREECDVVFNREWDSGGPGAGAGAERVLLFRELYWTDDSTFGLAGPFDTLEDALAGDVGFITSATERIECYELGADELIPLLRVSSAPASAFEINGDEWIVDRNGKIVRAKP